MAPTSRPALLWAAGALAVLAGCATPQASAPDTTSGPAPSAPDAVGTVITGEDVTVGGTLEDIATADAVAAADAGSDAATPQEDAAPDAPGPTSDADDDDDAGDDPTPVELPLRECLHTFTYAPAPGTSPASVSVAASFGDWQPGTVPMAEAGGGFEGTLDLSELEPGSYGYRFVVDGLDEWQLDPTNKMKRFDGELANSKLLVPACDVPELRLLERTVDAAAGSLTIEVGVWRGVGGEWDPGSPAVAWNFAPVDDAWDADRGTFLIERTGLPDGKHTFRFDAAGPAGAAEPLVVSAWVEPEPYDWRDSVLYFAFTDRFRDEAASAPAPSCLPPDSPGTWLGGDWAGITAAIEEGYFDDLGVNALWLNAPMDNPDDCVEGLYGKTYTAYHAYFPQDLFATEERFGSLADLRELVAAAHARGVRVLVDLVANHLYDTAPEWLEHQGEGWFHDEAIPCKPAWDAPEQCWFETYLPDLNHRNDEVVEHITEAALWWVREADLDGFRVDAVKHVHRHFLNTLRAKLDQQIEAHAGGVPFWTVGETFTGGWGGGTGESETLIKAYVSDDQLYGQFDFPLYWSILGAFAHGGEAMATLGDVMLGSAAFYGPDALMASFLGNHDVARFVSVAAGDLTGSCDNGGTVTQWDCPPDQPTEAEPYDRLRLAFTMLAAAPEIPLIYYGDEIGLAGDGDPDNRRMMPWAGLLPVQEDVRAHVGAVMGARAGSLALRRGAAEVVEAGTDHLVVKRSHAASGDVAYAVLHRGAMTQVVTIPLGAGEPATWLDAVSGSTVTAQGGSVSLSMGALSSRLLVPASASGSGGP